MHKTLEEEYIRREMMQVAVSRKTSQCTLSLLMCLGNSDFLKKQRNDLNLIKLENFCCHDAGQDCSC